VIGKEGFPRGMSPNREMCQIVERDAFNAPVVEKEATRLDQIDPDPEASGEPKYGARVLRNIRLDQCETQTTSISE
jgi:hypothetical protein